MTTPDAFLGACLWEINRQQSAALAAVHGPKAPRTPDLARLRRVYLQTYSAIAARRTRA